ncbi:hypothetical protein G6F46_003377 [Rhizopus delemar]|nr:hypothetical protein G6F55_002419 [Rhizopus delemar]KAG1553715.1 hypothetical protein G6F51_000418 [Rhizopus arrhizus]KAG1501370.1 hypothetical protein G6F54_003083 [Rhizopus delemar]KAG1515210.1 hypothetical protein G6F53_003084 [Rhizopus delemar]KAG1521331.1 hypothetical protein G6F52_006841 [Rhizopus delemar]
MSQNSALPSQDAASEALPHADSISKLIEAHLTNKAKWKPSVVEEIFNNELLPSNFAINKLALLESSQYLEKYLWPQYNKKASTNHVISIGLMAVEKSRQNIAWDVFNEDPEKFSTLFQRVTQLIISDDLSITCQRVLLVFLIHCFQSFENELVRTECLKLVTIGIWNNLADDSIRERLFNEYPSLQKLWNSSNKKLNAADDSAREQLEYERNWLSLLLKKFVFLVYRIPAEGEVDEEIIKYSERIIEFLIGLEVRLPTRRFFNTLLDDHQVIVLCQMAPFNRRENKDTDLLKELMNSLSFYAKFEVNDQTGVALTDIAIIEAHYQQLVQLQHIAFRRFREQIKELPLANLSSIETREDLLWHFKPLSENTLVELCESLGIRNQPVGIDIDVDIKEYLINVLVTKYEKRESQIKKISNQPLYPDEKVIFDDNLTQTQNYRGDRSIALPKLDLQFLTINDYLLRNHTLFRIGSICEVRRDIEDVVKRLSPRMKFPECKTEFGGKARMATLIQSFNVVDIADAKLGEDKPAYVKADVTISLSAYARNMRNEWDALRKHDTLFLVSIEATEDSLNMMSSGESFREHYGIKYIRGCEIVDFIGADGRSIDEVSRPNPEDRKDKIKGSERTIRVQLDTNQYKWDMDRYNKKHSEDIYTTFNVLVRRRAEDNNFKYVLETIRNLAGTNVTVPEWLHKIFLGYGDSSSAHYTKMADRLEKFDLLDTFLDWDHLKSSFPDRNVQPAPGGEQPLQPPYRLKLLNDPMEEDQKPVKKTKKSKKTETKTAVSETFEVESYKVPSDGPYPSNNNKQNQIRFSPAQAEAIYSGMNYGLTTIAGHVDVSKTEVAVQIIANLYRNYSDQRTLIITRNSETLDKIFEKVVELGVQSRHLIRIGHGEQELNSEVSFSKYSRIPVTLERRISLLQQVDQLARSLNVPGEHGSTCETAGHFYKVHVLPRWESFLKSAESIDTVEKLRDAFPFAQFFSHAPKPVFTDSMSLEEALESASGCKRYFDNLFGQLEGIRPFELLRYDYDRANYLLTKEAKIVGMTCTHAALKRPELIKCNFKYNNIVVLEADQILEIETFILLQLQESKEILGRLKRIVFIGDDSQSPIVKNAALQQYSNMRQSMFKRFIKLGVPTIRLD